MSNESLHEERARIFTARAQEARSEAVWLVRHLMTAEVMELADIERLGETHESWYGMASRLASFGLVEAGTVRIGAWKLTPWGKFVAQTAKELAQ